jgi:hypothetical protein
MSVCINPIKYANTQPACLPDAVDTTWAEGLCPRVAYILEASPTLTKYREVTENIWRLCKH